MRIHLEQLPHQEQAIVSVLGAMDNCLDLNSYEPQFNDVYANPRLNVLQGIDVKMETGTGKTYVYTRLMHELYRKFGLNKFVIVTPSLAIKEGTKSFISSEYATQHFRELFPEQKISLGVVNAGDFATKTGKRKQFAPSLSNFCEASRNDIGTVNVLLINEAMLGSKSMTRDDYDQTLVGGSSCPIEALMLTRPIVIIDEPHRFKKDGKGWKNIQSIKPQLIIRFGATFPDRVVGKGRSKIVEKDYDNLVYDLNAVQSFNQGLVKGIDVVYPGLPPNQASQRYSVVSATNQELVLRRDGREWTLAIGDQLSNVDSQFEGGITYQGKQLSNELAVAPGMSLIPGVWTNSYQELLLSQAIDAHFEKERELFHRPGNAPKVKTLSLFFIDNISSYRDKDGWLKRTFERLLKAKLEDLIAVEHGEYKDFLLATKASLNTDNQQVHAGYFAEDSQKTGDEAIQEQVDDILRNKEKLLQFRDEYGNWYTRRFLFSKWTLREGWDNPNVFVLTKLRTSGSEASKIQEVGRGLRLPVDELGNRLSDEEFRLTFLIDYSERDFAQRLTAEVNADGGGLAQGKITSEVLESLVETGYATSTDKAKARLVLDDVIDGEGAVLDYDALLKLVPLGVTKGKIRDKNDAKPVVHLRVDNWEKIRSLWSEVSKRYMLDYDRLGDDELGSLIRSAITRRVFVEDQGFVSTFSTWFNPETGKVELKESERNIPQSIGRLKYGQFVKQLGQSTNVPINLLHSAIVRALEGESKPHLLFNSQSLENIIQAFRVQFVSTYSQRYHYNNLDFSASLSVCNEDGSFKSEISQGAVGTKIAQDIQLPDNYLYLEAAYDSEIEREVLRLHPGSEVLVFGKIPRRSVKLPTYLGGTTSPDFVYAIREPDGNKVRLYALIETKDKTEENFWLEERVALEAQRRISGYLENVEIRLVQRANEVSQILSGMSG